MERAIVGLDVSKAWLDGYLPATGRRLRVSNHPLGIGKFLQILGDSTGCLVVMEVSGGYERTAHRELVAQGVPAAIVNPKRVRDFARGMGLEAKTDRVDARLIARYGDVMRPAARPLPDPARLELREALACRRQLVDEVTVRRQQLEHLTSPTVRARVEQALAFLRQDVKALLALLRARIAADAALAADFALLTSMPGCGPILAATLLAELPELGTLASLKTDKSPLRPAHHQGQTTQARPCRPHAKNARHPQRHVQGQNQLPRPKAEVSTTTVAIAVAQAAIAGP